MPRVLTTTRHAFPRVKQNCRFFTSIWQFLWQNCQDVCQALYIYLDNFVLIFCQVKMLFFTIIFTAWRLGCKKTVKQKCCFWQICQKRQNYLDKFVLIFVKQKCLAWQICKRTSWQICLNYIFTWQICQSVKYCQILSSAL